MRKIIKVYCKKDYLTYSPYAYKENFIYDAYQEDNSFIWVMTGKIGSLGGQEGCRFYNPVISNEKYTSKNILEFKEYFSTLKEVRKEKIKKLGNDICT